MKTIMNFVLHAFLSNVVLHTSIIDLGFLIYFKMLFIFTFLRSGAELSTVVKKLMHHPKLNFLDE